MSGWRQSIRVGAIALAAAMASPASAEIAIADAHIGEGDLWIVGRADEPNTEVILDDSFSARADERGNFQFRIPYHPATCVVLVKTAREQRAAVVANCGQRGPQGEPGPPGPSAAPVASAPAAPPPAPPAPQPAADVACAPKTPLYAAENGFRMWVVRRGNLAPGGAEPKIVLQVSIAGNVATTHGPDFAHMLTGGPPAQLERESGGRIAWEPKLGGLPGAIEIVSEGGGEVVSRLRFKECGTPPKRGGDPAPRATPGDPAADAPKSFPMPQGVFR